ncbi:hypothetical protein Bhyg_06879 [Pseudolycoriella hygida]|uniref:Uncharacterized protein n=1 Tax=Pseudolycoriella hygida TaxID=35572 RepID=A0A9Q0N3F1_9DIPT|nr:hypothetical protein Bhyg_06879 [Pseudolycoriella hygida]
MSRKHGEDYQGNNFKKIKNKKKFGLWSLLETTKLATTATNLFKHHHGFY